MNGKKSSKSLSQNEIVFYETENGKVTIAVRFEHENIWLTQKQMAELFGCSADNISLHLKNIYLESKLSPEATTEDFSVVQEEGGRFVVALKILIIYQSSLGFFLLNMKISYK